MWQHTKIKKKTENYTFLCGILRNLSNGFLWYVSGMVMG